MRIPKRYLIAISVYVLAFCSLGYAQPFTAKCVRVADGDTITVLTSDQEQIKIRLQGIDCPEGGQAFGKKAKQFASGWYLERSLQSSP